MFDSSKSGFVFREELFWCKLLAFIKDGNFTEEERSRLSDQLTEKGQDTDNAWRLLEYIERAETEKKIRYLVNATRSLLEGLIGQDDYFRICHVITYTIQEDLNFLGNNVSPTQPDENQNPLLTEIKDFLYDNEVQGLFSAALMYHYVFNAGGERRFAFTTLAEMVDQYAVNFGNIHKYPDHKMDANSPKQFISVEVS
jgi:hypothetical protein